MVEKSNFIGSLLALFAFITLLGLGNSAYVNIVAEMRRQGEQISIYHAADESHYAQLDRKVDGLYAYLLPSKRAGLMLDQYAMGNVGTCRLADASW